MHGAPDSAIIMPKDDRTQKRCCRLKGSLSAAEVHKQYSDGVTAFRRQIADATLRMKFTQEADVFPGLRPGGVAAGRGARHPPPCGVL